MRNYVYIILAIFLLFITFFTGFFIKKNFSISFFPRDLYKENLSLRQENQNLKAQIQRGQIIDDKNQSQNNKYLSAKIFSTYPFNTKNILIINAGSGQGIKDSMSVIVGENILIGQIIEVYENYSRVRTIFDPLWQIPVRIGEKEIDGLLQGGPSPKVALIEKNKSIQAEDFVYSASENFPYGLKIGEVGEIKESASGGVFKEAILKMPFNINELKEVSVYLVDSQQPTANSR